MTTLPKQVGTRSYYDKAFEGLTGYVPGAEWIFHKLSLPLFGELVVTQLRTTLAASASTTLTITVPQNQLRIPLSDDFGDVIANKINLTQQWDDIHIFGPIRATADVVTTNGVTTKITQYMGPVRSYVKYTFANTDTTNSQTLEFNSWALNIPTYIGNIMMKLIAKRFDDMGVKVVEGIYSDIIRS